MSPTLRSKETVLGIFQFSDILKTKQLIKKMKGRLIDYEKK